MKALYDFIIETDRRYNNDVDVDGKQLIINTEVTERDAEFVNREATVLAIPTAYDTPVLPGDKVLVHHNVFRRWYDMKEKERNCSAYLDENQAKVFFDQVFAYKRDDEWLGFPGFCFVEPFIEETKWGSKGESYLKGILRIKDYYLDHLGISNGSVVGFTPESEYAFYVGDKLLYRIYSNQITINYGHQERA